MRERLRSSALRSAFPSWLEFDWNGSGSEDPLVAATFGRHRGHDRIIYWSEQR